MQYLIKKTCFFNNGLRKEGEIIEIDPSSHKGKLPKYFIPLKKKAEKVEQTKPNAEQTIQIINSTDSIEDVQEYLSDARKTVVSAAKARIIALSDDANNSNNQDDNANGGEEGKTSGDAS